MCLPIADYQSRVNHVVIKRLHGDVRATVADLLPESEEDFRTQKPEELLQQIEERLENNPLEEHQRLRFNLAKQERMEDPEGYKERLHKYYEETLLQDEQQFVAKYVNSVYSKAMEELLRTNRPPLATIEALEKEIPYNVTQLRI